MAVSDLSDGPEKQAFTDFDRARALAVAFQRAEIVVDGCGGPGLRERAQYVLKHAREHKLEPRLYEIAWSVERTINCSKNNYYSNSRDMGSTGKHGKIAPEVS